jgi:RecA-family ATPase
MNEQTLTGNGQPDQRPQYPANQTPLKHTSKVITVQDLNMSLLEVDANDDKNLFHIRPANRWIELANLRPMPKMLFGELWYEGELCILFADTNLGKSILAVQIGDSISSGVPVRGFDSEANAQPVLYFDFELTDKQFQTRYSTDQLGPYKFKPHFYRAEMNPDATYLDKGYENFEDYLNAQIEKQLIATGIKVMIVDNLTYLRSETEQAKDALPLMKMLNKLKKKHGLSMLVLAHTPKRDATKLLTVNDLQGSKHQANFADSIFAIGQSHTDQRVRYIKQIKQRNTEKIYDADHIVLCQIAKEYNFLGFEFINYGREADHLKELGDKDRNANSQMAKDLSANGCTQREIAKQLGVSVSTVNSYLKKD